MLIFITIHHKRSQNEIKTLCECYEYYDKFTEFKNRVFIYTCDKTEYDELQHIVTKIYVDCKDPVFKLKFVNRE